jgi:hypothetical protein
MLRWFWAEAATGRNPEGCSTPPIGCSLPKTYRGRHADDPGWLRRRHNTGAGTTVQVMRVSASAEVLHAESMASGAPKRRSCARWVCNVLIYGRLRHAVFSWRSRFTAAMFRSCGVGAGTGFVARYRRLHLPRFSTYRSPVRDAVPRSIAGEPLSTHSRRNR